MSRRLAVAGLVAYLVALAAVTLGASPGGLFVRGARVARRIDGFGWVSSGDVERAANVLLFVPFGLLLCFALPTVDRFVVWLLCVAVSVAVEAAQFVLPGRDSTPVDVVTNATGAALGVLAAVVWTRARQRVRQQ
ncbi:VanZ family protein [Blastococcus saxobsidens]|uniref:VanZ family protein n=1 Tax=Blastococcus saxobsidens TaxID=138336 RepID=A0A6L9VYP6_9ACTN|nr:VanZ family protein [Blastococcus saxobsidens]NEK84300.1 VanZ family protein [Blastococcus saxobsidens]